VELASQDRGDALHGRREDALVELEALHGVPLPGRPVGGAEALGGAPCDLAEARAVLAVRVREEARGRAGGGAGQRF
jgi:hypothetical protein